MKIKLAILETDKSYLSRIVSTFGAKYADKFEIYSFTDQDVALASLGSAKIDVLLASDSFEIDPAKLPGRCGFAYLVESADIELQKGQRAICKFQKADLIYKNILSVYSEKASSIIGFKLDGGESCLIAFSSAAGGVGSSTMAAACALHFAMQGKKTLYLNLETFGSADLFFNGEGTFDLSDIIFALKSRKTNFHIKLESCVRRDPRGVCFYSQPKIALDRMELKEDEILKLLHEIKLAGGYDYIILDLDFSLDRGMLNIYRQAQGLVMVSNGSAAANTKTQRAFAALTALEQSADAPLTQRTGILYNRFSSKQGKMADIPGLRLIGGAPVYAGGTTEQILSQLAAMDMFDKIV